jgi:cytochrome c oxidase subunit 3
MNSEERIANWEGAPPPAMRSSLLATRTSPLPEPRFDRNRVGMACFLTSEAVFFSTLIVAYLVYVGPSVSGPQPAQALHLPLVIGNTIALLSSSGTMAAAVRGLQRGRRRSFLTWIVATLALGAAFLAGTAYEWFDLIVRQGLLPSTNLFGSTFFTLIGFHGLHVTLGLVAMLVLIGLVARGRITRTNSQGVELVSWYWHFVDAVWVVFFSVVYLYSR